jgi:hypothetical protein
MPSLATRIRNQALNVLTAEQKNEARVPRAGPQAGQPLFGRRKLWGLLARARSRRSARPGLAWPSEEDFQADARARAHVTGPRSAGRQARYGGRRDGFPRSHSEGYGVSACRPGALTPRPGGGRSRPLCRDQRFLLELVRQIEQARAQGALRLEENYGDAGPLRLQAEIRVGRDHAEHRNARARAGFPPVATGMTAPRG